MKRIILPLIMALTTPSVLADYGHITGCGMDGCVGNSLYGILWLAISAFVVSVIFWFTYNWIVKRKKAK